ncbi:hypothetical protein KY346_01920 [Candidatus Woesearchaeota archaeon]|nr:hypothetical protein [Candidatus Woesearchaeota archaeon]
MKALKIILLAMLMVIAIAGVVHAASLPVAIDEIEVDDVSLAPDRVTRLDIERGQTIDVEVLVTAEEDIDDVEAEVFLSGFEYNKWERASDIVGPKNLQANTQYKLEFSIPISDEFEKDDYKLRVLLTNRDHEELIQSYNLKIDVPRHSLRIDDVVFYPESSVKAGSALLASVRIENKGEMQEDDVKVKITIPNLGVSATEYINEIEEDDDEEETEEIFLRIPQCAEPGLYDVEVMVYFSEKHYSEKITKTIQVTENPLCTANDKPKTTITIGSQMESFEQGESAIYPITITNSGRESKSYTLTVDAQEWANVRISPSSTIVLEGGKTQSLYVFVEAGEKAPQGAQVLTATVSSSGEQLEQVALTANITKAPSNTLKKVLEVIFIVLVVLLVIIGLIVGISKLRGNDSDDFDDDLQAEEYY